MRLRRWTFVIAVAALPLQAAAQASPETLADIRQQIAALSSEIVGLRHELSTTTGAQTGLAGGSALQRIDAIEAELVRLTAKTEQLEFRVNSVISDGTNRIGDLEFRLCELEAGCDVGALPPAAPLGGAAAPDVAALPAPVVPATPAPGGAELAVSEQADFDRAREVLGQGDFRTAAELLATFTQSYPGSPLTQEAHFLRGDALGKAGDTANAARAYLEAFSGAPTGPFAADALLRLGESLGQLGQLPEACVTLTEVGARFPGSLAATQAPIAMQGLGCQ